MADITLQRKNMVESQVRPSDVTDRRITAAMLDVAREAFVPDRVKPLAYMDDAIEVAPSRRMMAPRTFARLLQLASIEVSDNVLDVGCAGGYSAAVLSRLSHKVIALEQDAALAGLAKTALAAAGAQNVTVVSGELAAGHAAAAAYDVIVIEGQVEVIPETLLAQLGVGGRLVAVVGDGGAPQAVLIKKSHSGLARRVGFDASAPRLPGFEKPKSFVF